MNYAQEVYKLISNYLPLTDVELGVVIPALSVSKSGSSIILDLSSANYTFIEDQISDNNNYSYTSSNFRIKNNIASFEVYPESSSAAFGFMVKFNRITNFDNGDQIPLAGFGDSDYDTTYQVVRKIDDLNMILSPINDLAIENPVGDLGYYSTLYSSGLNGVKTITALGSDQISFEMEDNLVSSIDTIDDLDLTTMPNLWFYQENILTMYFDTFVRNLTSFANEDYLIIDTDSLSGTPMRSSNNKTDAAYFSFGTNAFFYREYTMDIYYMLQRSEDDDDNQTESGTDIMEKQVLMYEALNSILRRPIPSDTNTKVISSMTITNDDSDKTIVEGSSILKYQLSFVVNFLPASVKDFSDEGSYLINQVNYNTDEIII